MLNAWIMPASIEGFGEVSAEDVTSNVSRIIMAREEGERSNLSPRMRPGNFEESGQRQRGGKGRGALALGGSRHAGKETGSAA